MEELLQQTLHTVETQEPDDKTPIEAPSVKVENEGGKPKRIVWTKEMDSVLLATLAEAAKTPQRGNNGFKPEVYHKAALKVCEKAKVTVAVSNVRNRLDHLKRHWSIACSLMGRSGWSYDFEEQKITADFDVWEQEVKANPKSSWVRGKQLYWFQQANEVWAGQVATGLHAFSSADTVQVAGASPSSPVKSSPTNSPPGELRFGN